jgi:sugar phosphate permease
VWIALGFPPDFAAPGLGFAMASLATAIPSAPGFVGTFDYFGALGAVAHGMDWNSATAFIVVSHIVLVGPYALVSLLVLVAPRRPSGEPANGSSAN